LTRFKEAVREAGILILVAAALGFIYTSATEKGMFARSVRTKSPQNANVPAPSMISQDEARAMFDAGRALFVDARHDFDFKLGHIKGAISLPLKEYDLKRSVMTGQPKDRLIVAYCDGADCNSSIELSVKLMKEGFQNVKIFFGGWRDWVDAGLPVEKQP
jgi:rhodanese-related sulfurtransferase